MKLGTKISCMKKWDGFDFEYNRSYENPPREGTDASDECYAFNKAFRAYLNRSLKPYGWQVVKSKPNYFDVTVVITDGDNYMYISIGDVRYTNNVCDRILYRTMAHAKDWRGGNNNYTNIDNLVEDCMRLAARTKKVV